MTVSLVLAVGLGAAGGAMLEDGTATDRPALMKAGGQAPPSSCRLASPPSRFSGERGTRLRCFGLPGRLVPSGSVAEATVAYQLDRRTFLVSFIRYKEGFYRVWQRRDGEWHKLFERSSLPDGGNAISLEDVTHDDRRDVLVQGLAGSGLCGARDVLGIEATRVRPLLLRTGCEVTSNFSDGLVYLRETIGSCAVPRAHCYGGVQITIRGWTGHRVTTNHQVVRCLRRDTDPHRACRA